MIFSSCSCMVPGIFFLNGREDCLLCLAIYPMGPGIVNVEPGED